MHSYSVVLNYNNGTSKPYMLTNVLGHNENEAIAMVHDTMVELMRRANKTRQEIIDAISIKSINMDI